RTEVPVRSIPGKPFSRLDKRFLEIGNPTPLRSPSQVGGTTGDGHLTYLGEVSLVRRFGLGTPHPVLGGTDLTLKPLDPGLGLGTPQPVLGGTDLTPKPLDPGLGLGTVDTVLDQFGRVSHPVDGLLLGEEGPYRGHPPGGTGRLVLYSLARVHGTDVPVGRG